MTQRSFAAVAIATIALAACGTPATDEDPGAAPSTTVPPTTVAEPEPDTEPETEPEPADEPATGWEVVRIGDPPADGSVALAEHGGDMWVVRSAADGESLLVSTVDGAHTTEIEIGWYAVGVHLASTPFGLVLTASGGDFVPHAWMSTDGEVWSETVIAERPMDVTGLTWTGSALFVSGAGRPEANPGMGPFQPVLLITTDGELWREVDLGIETPDSWLAPVVVSGDRLLTSVRVPSGDFQVPATLESRDDGATWQPIAGEAVAPEQIGAAGDALFGTNGAPRVYDGAIHPLLVESSDGWEVVDLAALIGPYQWVFARTIADGPSGVIAMQVDRPIEYCYVDRRSCEHASLTVVVDGRGEPALLDLDGIGVGSSVASAAFAANGDLALLVLDETGLHAATWPATAGSLPLAPPIELSEPDGPPLIEWGAVIEAGNMYRYPLYTHCGIDVLGELGGQNWWIDGEPTEAYDPSVEGFGSLLGEIHMVAEDRIEYVLDGEVIAAYTPRQREIPGCD